MVDINDVIPEPKNMVSWVLYDEHGNIKDSGKTMNQVQTAHKSALATQTDSTPAYATGIYGFMWVGTGAVGGVGATDLTTPVAGGRQAVTTSTSAAAVVTTVATITGIGAAVTEVGAFITNAGADMMCTAALVCTMVAADSIVITWTKTFG